MRLPRALPDTLSHKLQNAAHLRWKEMGQFADIPAKLSHLFPLCKSQASADKRVIVLKACKISWDIRFSFDLKVKREFQNPVTTFHITKLSGNYNNFFLNQISKTPLLNNLVLNALRFSSRYNVYGFAENYNYLLQIKTSKVEIRNKKYDIYLISLIVDKTI